MPIKKDTLINTAINSSASVTGTLDLEGVTPKRITLLVQLVETGSPTHTSLDLTVEVSADVGVNLITYDKLITEAGVDAPVSSKSYAQGSDHDDVISLSVEDVVEYIKVTIAVTGSAPDSGNYITAKVWVLVEY